MQPEALSEQVDYLHQKKVILQHCTDRDFRQFESPQMPALTPSHRNSTSQQLPRFVAASA